MSAENRLSKQGPFLSLLTILTLTAGCNEALPDNPPTTLPSESNPVASLSKPEKIVNSLPEKKKPSSPTPTEKTIFKSPNPTSTPEPSPSPSPEKVISKISPFPIEQIDYPPTENIIFSHQTKLTHPWLEPPEDMILVISPTQTETSTPTPIPTAISIPAPSPTLPPRPRSQIITPETTAEIQPSLWEEKALEAVQKVRAESGVPPVNPLPLLMETARERSLYMAETDRFSHYTLEGKTVFDFLRDKGYPLNRRKGEILCRTNAAEFDQVMAVCINLFLASPSHRVILLKPEYRLAGVGVAPPIDRTRMTYLTVILSSYSYPLK